MSWFSKSKQRREEKRYQKQLALDAEIRSQNKKELKKIPHDEQSILQSVLKQAGQGKPKACSKDDLLAGIKISTMQDIHSDLPALPIDYAGVKTDDWVPLVRYLEEKMDQISNKGGRTLKFTPADLTAETKLNAEYNLAPLKDVAWSQIIKFIKRDWYDRKSIKVTTPFLDMGHWIKFNW